MKVSVIGFDGASPILVEKWIEQLPTFRRLKEEGLFGFSIPPIPAQTPVAWTTFMTGKNPVKHTRARTMLSGLGIISKLINIPLALAERVANLYFVKRK